ncbi:MAG TPA: UvrD-helicase domain-containing protein [Pirellulales bacterium]|nr:UvrD-helicase domain-containing protein [Pirellulales bacterium]
MTAAATNFTSEQRAAIEARNISVALSAGAGCGKTFVLTERFLADLDPSVSQAPASLRFQPADLHELIAITFTDRAAREMRDRIRQKCYERLQTAPDAKQADYWLGLLRSLDAARVSTIHSFCGALLRTHAVEAGLDPRFTVMEQSQADTLLAELCEDVLREKLSDNTNPLHAPLLNLTAHFGLKRLQEMVATLITTNRAAYFEPWLAKSAADVIALWDIFRREVAWPTALAALAQSPPAKTVLEVIRQCSDATGKLRNRLAVLSQLLPMLPASGHPGDDLAAIVENARVQSAGSKKNWSDESLYDRFKDAAEELRKAAKAAAEFTQLDPAAAQADAEAGLQLLRIAHAVQARYAQRKRELAWVDYNDLLVQAHRLLTDPAHQELQQQLASQTRLLLVDECQDTDPLQVELIKALCGPHTHDGKLFFVGDYKQSIYRFRGADPGVFRRLEQETPRTGRLPLTTNFRSQPAILHFVNALFSDVLSAGNAHAASAVSSNGKAPSSSQEAAQPYQPLRAHWPQTTSVPAIEFLWATATEEKSETDTADATTNAARRREADFIARRIRHMVDHREPLVAQRQIDGQVEPRPVQFGDIAMLFRALSDVQCYEQALRSYDIHYYLVGGHAFYAQQEIYDVVNLLRALASPADVVSLAGVLRSPLFALADETLFWLAQHPQGLSAGLFAQRLPQELDDIERRRAAFAAATLHHLRNRKDRLSIAALLNEAFALTGYDAALLAEFMGQRKLANVRKLLEQARSFDRSGVLGLNDFIVQLSQFVGQLPHEPLAATHPEKTDVVRLMTIHQAKGLEFPLVFVPDVNRRTNKNRDSAAWHPQLGPLLKLKQRGKHAGVTGFDLFTAVGDPEEKAELVRLLYVATTRAADYLILSAGMNQQELEAPRWPWAKLLAERFNLQTGEFRATLPPGGEYDIPRIKVTMAPPAVDASAQSPHTWHNLDAALSRTLEMAANETKSTGAAYLPTSQMLSRLAQPVAIDRAAQRRFSVSRLNGLLQPAEEQPQPSFFSDDADNRPPLAGAGIDLGTLVHQALARIDFAELASTAASEKTDALPHTVQRCLESCAAYNAELAETAAELLMRFAQSSRARELAAAKLVRRELEFLLAWPPNVSSHSRKGTALGTDAAPNRYLQGFIDCLYQDAAGCWHLLDYKTNQVSADAVDALAPQFELQLGVYALAVEQILHKPPAELTVHFLRPSAEHPFAWDTALRARTVDKVNQAIESAVHDKLAPASTGG